MSTDKKIEALNKNIDMMNAVNQNIVNLIVMTKATKKLLIAETPATRIEVAKQRCTMKRYMVEGLCYFDLSGQYYRNKELMGGILESFFRGSGHFLPPDARKLYREEGTEEEKKAFRNKIVEQVRRLIGHGHKAELKDSGNVKFAIYC